jgi:putative ABC transport system permease protein
LTIPHWGGNKPTTARIVGVVGHVEHYRLDGSVSERPQIYYSFYQLPDEWVPAFRGEVTLAVRTSLDAATAMPVIRNAVYATGSDQPVYNIHTMEELVSGSMARQRFPMLLLVAFAVLALVLAAVGIYGVISYSVAQRVRELGIRMALGAEKRDIFRMVIGYGLRLALAGLAIGIVAASILTRLLASFSHLLYGVGASDPATFAVLSLVLTSVSILACYIPARRAAKVDPMVALRHE